MKALLDFVPLLLFLIVYRMPPQEIALAGFDAQLGGIMSATVVLLVSSALIYSALAWHQRRLDLGQWVTLLLSFVFGTLTLVLHDEAFIKWKAPMIHWAFAIGFLASPYVGDRKLLIERLTGPLVQGLGGLPAQAWRRLNQVWAFYFLAAGALQLYVAFWHSAIWVEFKIFGSIAMSMAMLTAQALYVLTKRVPAS